MEGRSEWKSNQSVAVRFYQQIQQDGRWDALMRMLREMGGGLYQKSAEAALVDGGADATVFGSTFLANPDLPERFRQGVPLNTQDKSTFYSPGAQGYTDYPLLSGKSAN